tara:strand:- start:619 stop:882 length:264 start_codon:yes stop_codon:yes gene_type:complete
MDNSRSKKIKKLLFRSMHRGTKEMDIILGNFAKIHLDSFSGDDLNEFEKILDIPDDKLFSWYMKQTEIPSIINNKILKLLMNYKLKS